MKLSIFFEKQWLELGVFAKTEFLQLFIADGEEMDTVMEVTTELIDKVTTMKVYQSGFTEKIKEAFLKFLNENIGKKLLMVDDWGIPKIHQEYYFDVVENLNKNLSLDDAIKADKAIYNAKAEAVKV